MIQEHPEPVVSEATGRKALATVIGNFTTTQKQLGAVPSAAQAEAYCKPIVEETIKKHEEREARRILLPHEVKTPSPRTGPSKARIDRGEVGPYQVVANETPGWKEKQRAAKKANAEPLLRKRLEMLEIFPEWKNRLLKAAFDGDVAAMNSGCPEDRTNVHRRWSIITDFAMRVVEDSNRIFGDFRDRKRKPDRLIFGPLGVAK